MRFEIHTIKTDKRQPFKNDIVQPQGIISTLVTINTKAPAGRKMFFVLFVFLYKKKNNNMLKYTFGLVKKKKRKERMKPQTFSVYFMSSNNSIS